MAVALHLLPSRLPIQAASETLLISEVLYNPIGAEPDREWIEIYNAGAASIDLTNYKVGDEETLGGTEGMVRFPNGVSILPGQVIVIANRATAFFAVYGFKPDYEILNSDGTVPNMLNTALASGSVALDNDGDEVILLDAGDVVVDVVSWADSAFAFNPPPPNIPEAHSLERRPANLDTDTAGDWVDQASPAPRRADANLLRVVSPSDSGLGTLRQALLDATAGDTIRFEPSFFPPGSPATILLQSALPTLSQDNVTIDASDAGVILDGTRVFTNGLAITADGCTIWGLTIQNFSSNGIFIAPGASGNTIGGDRSTGAGPNGQGNLIIHNGQNGIQIWGAGADGNMVYGNYIGTDASGASAAGNVWNGVEILQGAQGNQIGGGATWQRNILSGNGGSGVRIEGSDTADNRVQGNTIGANASGAAALPNDWHGVELTSYTHDNLIGGNRLAGQGNLLSGNRNHGLVIAGYSHHNTASGNIVGPDATGAFSLGYHPQGGIDITDHAHHNVIGGTELGEGNLISGNQVDGLALLNTAYNQVLSNTVGLTLDGSRALPNGGPGIFLVYGVTDTHIVGNVTSGNLGDGIRINGGDTVSSTVRGNRIGTDPTGTRAIANDQQGVLICNGAHAHRLENNIISGNGLSGVGIWDSGTMSNVVQDNYIGVNANGNAGLGNGQDGVKIDGLAHDNRVERNVLSGNAGNGVVIIGQAHHNVVRSNLIGTDKTGAFAIGQTGGGVDLASGANHNTIGGSTAADRNVISGNGIDGIFIEGWETRHNTIQGNFIGTNISGTAGIPNGWGFFILNGAPDNIIANNLISHNTGHGLHVTSDALGSEIVSNTISSNEGAGVHFDQRASLYEVMTNTIAGNGQDGVLIEESCFGITLTHNLIYDNAGKGIRWQGASSGLLPDPILTVVTTQTITGTTVPNARVELFSDDYDEGRIREGIAIADANGRFAFTQPGGLAGPNVTAISTDPSGKTSGFSQPAHLLWTILLYLNGDNDLAWFMFDTITNTVAAGPSPRANVLALVDYTTTMAYTGTVLYNLTYGQAAPIAATLGGTMTVPGELNMGDGQTLVNFVRWGQSHYPARHTMLAIVDHGGGWAPNSGPVLSGTMPIAKSAWMAGSSGLSWDFTNGYDYLDSPEARQAMAAISNNGADPLDVVFYDVCLMGMAEVAYQIKDYAAFFVSSQNIGWAPLGPQSRYIQTIHGIAPATSPRQLAELLVTAYANSMPPEEHPFTLSALDLTQLSAVTIALNQFAAAISQTLTGPEQAAIFHTVYGATQKVDYDADLSIEPATDGFVDVYDLAVRASEQYTQPAIIAAAQAVTSALETAIVAEQHRSGTPWTSPDMWDLDDVHGLSVFLPLGEDLELPFTSLIISGSAAFTQTHYLHLRDMYSCDQLQFVCDTSWGELIDAYYDMAASPVPTRTTQGPMKGLIQPDVVAPQTVVTSTSPILPNETVTLTWASTDGAGSGVAGATLWYSPTFGQWTAISTQTGASGLFTFALSRLCKQRLAVQAIDRSGNRELLDSGANHVIIDLPCSLIYLPLVLRGS